MLNKDNEYIRSALVEYYANNISYEEMRTIIIEHGWDVNTRLSVWLNEEYSPFTPFELEFMRNVDSKYKYIARDENKDLFLYEKKPYKSVYCTDDGVNVSEWDSHYSFTWISWLNNCFKFIKWSDEEPVCIDDYVNRKYG